MTTTLAVVWQRLKGSLGRGKRDGELLAEMESHVELHTADNIRAGMSPDQARRAALVKFGSMEAIKEEVRDRRGLPVFEMLFQDLRYAARALRKRPAFTAVATLTLALGIGGAAAIFSVLKAVILQPPAYYDPARLYVVHEIIPQVRDKYPLVPVNASHFRTWQSSLKQFESLAAFDYETLSLTGMGPAQRIGSARVTADMFDVLGVMPLLGTRFTAADEQQKKNDIVILSYGFWKQQFGGDPAILGTALRLDGRAYTVAGVMPPSFRFPTIDEVNPIRREIPKPDIIRPLIFTENELRPQSGSFNFFAIARLKAGVSPEQAAAELNAVQAGIARSLPAGMALEASVAPLHKYAVREVQGGLTLLMCAVSAVLLMICANIAHLLLAQGAARTREFAIRAALGVSKGRLLRQLLTETMLLSSVGCLLGIGIAFAGVQVIRRYAPAGVPRLEEAGVDSAVLLFALAVSLITGVLFGVLPSWRLHRTDPNTALKSGSRNSTEHAAGSRAKYLLVTAESAVCAALLLTAGLLGTSFYRILQAEKGFSTDRLVAVEFQVPAQRYNDGKDRSLLNKRMIERAVSMPGIRAAGVTSVLPLRGHDNISLVTRPDDHRPIFQRPISKYSYVSPGYLETLGVPLRSGRAFVEADRGRNVAVISETTAARIWPGEDAVGKKFHEGDHDDRLTEVIGIAADVRSVSLTEDPGLMIYAPDWVGGNFATALLVRTSGPTHTLAGSLRKALFEIEPEMPVTALRTMEEVVDDSVASRRFQTALIAGFAFVAISLACLGVFGVVSYSVAQRRPELGIRLALGARPAQIRAMVVRQGLTPVLAGCGLGLAAALASARLLEGFLYQVKPTDPVVVAASVATLMAVGLLACYAPAQRATRVDPVATLRAE